MKRLLKIALAKFGFKLQRIDTPMRSLEWGLQNLAKVITVDSVIDVGVARGTPELYQAFRGKRFILVEANPHYMARLQELEKELPARSFCTALGDHDGTITLNSTSANKGEFSSVYPAYRESKPIEVPLARLDTIVSKDIGPYLLKIDVEGAELDVLKGATGVLDTCVAIVIEVSIQPQRFAQGGVFSDVVCFLKQYGFEIFDLLAGSTINGQLYQLDAVFLKI